MVPWAHLFPKGHDLWACSLPIDPRAKARIFRASQFLLSVRAAHFLSRSCPLPDAGLFILLSHSLQLDDGLLIFDVFPTEVISLLDSAFRFLYAIKMILHGLIYTFLCLSHSCPTH